PYPVTTMQDLGGCRAILGSMREVNAVLDTFIGEPSLFPLEGTPRHYNYIQKPKADGYRGIHIVGRYKAKSQQTSFWSGYRIEIQLRTVLQHACSTAVETVATFTGFPLKFGKGPDDWKRFFVLASSAFAILERSPLCPGAPEDSEEDTASTAPLPFVVGSFPARSAAEAPDVYGAWLP